MNDTDLAFAPIEETGKLFRKRKPSPLDLTKIMLARTEHLNPKLNAYIPVTAELALAQAKKAESELFAPRARKGNRDRGPLHGIPISLKDNIYTKGIRTAAGSKILKDFIPQHDAKVVIQLKEARAVILGKTNMHEFAYGVTSNNPHYGPVHNPWDLARISGGSSGGSAAAVAAGLCYGSIGTDTGGSIRIPAALCGVVGLKPTFGRVSVKDVIPLSPHLDCVGPLARTTDYGEDVRARLEIGAKVSATAYLRAMEVRNSFIEHFHAAMAGANVDALAVPTTPIAAPMIGEETTLVSGDKHPTRALLLRLNRPANLAGLPAVSVPCGFTPEGLPVGFQLIGAVTDEHLLLQIAKLFELACPARSRPPLAT